MHNKLTVARRAGFTLVELLVVIAIIGILAGIVIGMAGYASGKSDRSKTMSNLERLKGAIEEYRLERGNYPKTNKMDEGLMKELSNYVQNISMFDSWGRTNIYVWNINSPFQFQLYSAGADGKTNTEDDVNSAKGAY